ncbi:hypothetical protein DdX_08596 [Ditylenchus destructor]|uniref:Uncharacterized protein n=1 Tax=Ditylenchus destructor TaxID=166010 RepID=A0AAD4R708_9BILA|nr:hypothetical protein DdX_08596 [Ditylenchus destructor]
MDPPNIGHESDSEISSLHEGGTIKREEGTYSARSSGGQIAIVRSLNIARSRILGTKTATAEPIDNIEETSLTGIEDNDQNYRSQDLHTAYRLPLQRLSDAQLSLLLKRYSGSLDRAGAINKLQQLMLERNQGLRLIRPTLLTNVNVLPSEWGFPKVEESHSRALGSSTSTADIDITLHQNSEEINTESNNEDQSQSNVEESRKALKQKYETIRQEFLAKLEQLNTLKRKLLLSKSKTIASTTDSTPTTSQASQNSESTQDTPEPTHVPTPENLAGQSTDQSTDIISGDLTTSFTDANPTTGSDLATASVDDLQPITASTFEDTTATFTQSVTEQPQVTDESSKSEGVDSLGTTVQTASEGAITEGLSSISSHPESGNNANDDSTSTPSPTENEHITAAEESSVTGLLSETSSPSEQTEVAPAFTSSPLESQSSVESLSESSTSGTTHGSGLLDNEPTDETTSVDTTPIPTTSDQIDGSVPPREKQKGLGTSKLMKKLIDIIRAKLRKGHNDLTEAATLPISENPKPVVVSTSQFVQNHEQEGQNLNESIGKEETAPPRAEILSIEKSVKRPVPKARPVPRIFSARTKLEDTEKEQENSRESSLVNEEPIHVGTPTEPSKSNTQLKEMDDELADRAEIISDNEPPLNDGKVRVDGGENFKSSLSFSMKRVSDLSATQLVSELQKELKERQQKPKSGLLDNDKPESSESQNATEKKNEDVDPLQEFAEANDEENACDAIACDFEKGDLCQWEASKDELGLTDRHYFYTYMRHRSKRQSVDQPSLVQRTWHNWEGRYRNRLTGIARAQVFSHTNRRFAASYVRPNQRATLSGRILTGEEETIRFRAWEATRDVRLRLCCDTVDDLYCVWESEKGVRRGSRRWKEHTATCPKGTKKMIFECLNEGPFQGACGLDNIHLLNQHCPNVIPLVGVRDNDRRRRFH